MRVRTSTTPYLLVAGSTLGVVNALVKHVAITARRITGSVRDSRAGGVLRIIHGICCETKMRIRF